MYTNMEASFINPNEVVKNLPLHDGMVVADLGCGSGFFSLAMAQIVKPTGKIIAIDIWKPALDTLGLKAKLAGLFNIIETKQVNLENPKGTGLNKESVDLVLISNVLFQIDDKEMLFQEIWRILKYNGYLVLLEWHPEKLPNSHLLKPVGYEALLKILLDIGFKRDRDILFTATHYGLLLKKENN